MDLFSDIRHRARDMVGPFIGFCLTLYFGYHAVQGDRGLVAWLHLNQHLRGLEKQLAESTARREVLENRVNRLRPDNLDPDLLEERGRFMLNLARENEVVIFNDQIDSVLAR